ncbi:MAG TPA: DUF2147 domain-containing protein [Sphingomonas sp.]
MAPMLLAALLAAPSADTAIGRWRTETRNGIVDIRACGASLCGTLVTSDGIAADPALTDSKNKDEKLRVRPLKGVAMLSGFTRDGAGWSGGSVYNPDDGGTYKGKLTPADADHLSVRGCIVWPLCKTQTWTRVR